MSRSVIWPRMEYVLGSRISMLILLDVSPGKPASEAPDLVRVGFWAFAGMVETTTASATLVRPLYGCAPTPVSGIGRVIETMRGYSSDRDGTSGSNRWLKSSK